MHTAKDLFERWYVDPLATLKALPNGDGGFIALATSCFLYERYATAIMQSKTRKGASKTIIDQFAKDFAIDKKTAKTFWEVIRNGLLHGAMPKQQERGKRDLPKWAFRQDFKQPVELSTHNDSPILKVQPWLVADRVIALWKQNLDLLEKSNSFPWAQIGPLPF